MTDNITKIVYIQKNEEKKILKSYYEIWENNKLITTIPAKEKNFLAEQERKEYEDLKSLAYAFSNPWK